MSKRKVYKCDVCGAQTDLDDFNKFKRTKYEWKNGWVKDRFDICNDCLFEIRLKVNTDRRRQCWKR